jgi:hypothetical protein
MKTVRINKHFTELPETPAEAVAMLDAIMDRYYDKRGGNVARMVVAAKVAYALAGDRFNAPDPLDS